MKIFVNDSPHQAPKEIKLKSFLHSINLDDFRGWAVALNEAVIPEDEMENVRELYIKGYIDKKI